MLRVAIVGGGPSGIYALAELVRAESPFHVTIYESGEKPGLGTPYDPALNHPSLLANIGSFELPAVVDTLEEWLGSLSAKAREGMNVDEVSARAFYPRVVLGAYFTAQYRKLARRAGARLKLRARTRVVDVACEPDSASITSQCDGVLTVERFDFAVVATGHRSRRGRPVSSLCAPAYPAPKAPPERSMRVSVLGASLTAIDVVLSIALQRGDFVAGASGLKYLLSADAQPLAIEMLSRRGVLPEADFYFQYPHKQLRFCNAKALARASLRPGALDLAFDLLCRELAGEDPAYAERIELKRLDADSFADAYFAEREAGDPFEAARRNLAEALAGVRARRVSAYRDVILRAHQAFAELAPKFSERDAARFRRGLQRVFVDNYAAVPPLSVERLLALQDAGVLALRKIRSGYALKKDGEAVEIVAGSERERYDLVVDARGETAALAREIPFPTLRLQILANQLGHPGDELEVTDELQLAPGLNPVGRVFCLAAPFLLRRRPFVQGLTSAQEMAAQVVRRLLRGDAAPLVEPAKLMDGGTIYLNGGLVVATPAHMS